MKTRRIKIPIHVGPALATNSRAMTIRSLIFIPYSYLLGVGGRSPPTLYQMYLAVYLVTKATVSSWVYSLHPFFPFTTRPLRE